MDMRRRLFNSGIVTNNYFLTIGSFRRSWLIIAFTSFIALFSANGQNLEYKATLDTASIILGQQVFLNLNFTAPKEAKVIWPKLQDSITSHIQIVRKSAIDTIKTEALRTYHQRITITSFDSGVYIIPPITVGYKLANDSSLQFALSQSIAFKVQTLQVDTTRAIKDIKGPMDAPLTFAEILPWVLAALALVIIVTFLIYYFRKRKNNEPFISLPRKPKVPPYQVALESLNTLKSKKLWQGGRMKEYHSELTDIIRLYIENQMGIAAIEMTTDEILDTFNENKSNDIVLKRLRQLLTTADLAKFAKAEPLPSENELSMENAVGFVNETMPLEQANDVAKQTPESQINKA
jgi:hypothetical protein